MVTIGDEVYDVLLDCTSAVVHAVEFVLKKISVFFDDLIKWLGFLFVWSDVLRTHDVLKNVLATYMAQCVNDIGSAESGLKTAFTDAQSFIDTWAGIPDDIPASLSGATLDSTTASASQPPGQASPQSNWGLQQLKGNAVAGDTDAQPTNAVLGDVESLLKPLVDALATEKDVLSDASTRLKSDVIDKIHELSVPQLIEAVLAIVADALLQSIENVLLAALEVLQTLAQGVLDLLTAKIDIPVLSSLYQELTGDDLSILDVLCLVAAIPVTLGYKLIAAAAPFPADATTAALIAAPDFATIRSVCDGEAVAADLGAALGGGPSHTTNQIMVLAAGIGSAVGATVLAITPPLAKKYPNAPVIPVINSLFYLLYVAPDVIGQIPDLKNKKWWAIMNEVLTDLMVVKALVDMSVKLTPTGSTAKTLWTPVTPWLDCGGNLIWQVPTTAAWCDRENWNVAGDLGFAGGTCFDMNGIFSPLLADDSDPDSFAAAAILAGFLNLAYGALSCAASALTFDSPPAIQGGTTE